MKQKKLYIHIGMPKTGSSAIQAFLNLNYKWLLTKGMCYPEGHTDFSQAFQTSCGNAPGLYNWILNNNEQTFKKFLLNSQTDKVILSSEMLFHVVKNKPQEFANYFKNYDIKVICYIRKLDDLVESALKQLVKNHSYMQPDNFLDVANSHVYYSCLLELNKYLSKDQLLIRKYSLNDFVGGSVYSDFVNAIDILNPDLEDPMIHWPEKTVNPSLGPVSFEFRRIMNRLEVDLNMPELMAKLNSEISHYAVEVEKKVKLKLMDTISANELYNKYKVPEKNFLETFGEHLSFKKDHQNNVPNYRKLTENDIDSVLKFIAANDQQTHDLLIERIKHSKNHDSMTHSLFKSILPL
jgi:hypothetical protein